MKSKKGISAVVATVLIILITVAAVTIIWAAIIPMINNQLDRGSICLDAVSQVTLVDAGYTCINTTVNGDGNYSIFIQAKHGAKDFRVKKIQALVSIDGNAVTREIIVPADQFGPNEIEVFNVSGPNFNTSTKLEIAPIVAVGQTEETCDISATTTLTAC
jgi:flagellin-like protein